MSLHHAPCRILICTPSHALRGGVERIIESLDRGLPERGFELVVGLARGSRFHDPDLYRAAYPGLTTIDIDGTGGRGPDRVRGVCRAIRTVDPDIVLIARLFDAYPAAAAMKLAGHRLRLAVTIQAFEPEYFIDAAEYAPFLDLCVTSGRLIKQACEMVVHLPAECVASIPGGVKPAKRRTTGSATPLRLGYVGRLEAVQKRVLDLPPLLAELQKRGIEFSCNIAGSGPAEAELMDAITELHLGDRVTMQGWLSTAELYDRVYPELDVLLHFAEWEGITIAPREAMAHGVVPVISRFAGLVTEGQFVEETNALTFPIGDVHAAAGAVERLARDPALWSRLSIAAAESQSGIRSEEGAIDGWAAVFRRTLDLQTRIGSSLPPAPAQYGRLSWLPAFVANRIRRLKTTPQLHDDPGAEWPHWSGRSNAPIVATLRDLARSAG